MDVYTLFTNGSNKLTRNVLVTEDASFTFSVKSCGDIYIILHNNPGQVTNDAYYIVMGYDLDSKTIITKKSDKDIVHIFDTPDILNCDSFKDFTLSWKGNAIELTGEGKTIFNWEDDKMLPIQSVALGTKHAETDIWNIPRDSGMNTAFR